jgi:fructokinase
MTRHAPLFAAIEAGGTKFVCGLGRGPDEVVATTRLPTTTPSETLAACAEWFEAQRAEHGDFAALGIGSFGPLDLHPASPSYGRITTTPKPGWQQADLLGFFRDRLQVPVALDTDVNAAVLGEHLWGAGQGLDPLVYITVGTGVGVGVLIHGQLLHGLLHPEAGHLLVPPPVASQAPNPAGQCPFHDHCLEGYISGPALAKRWGAPADTLSPDHPAWPETARLMGQALMNLTLSLCPRRIILGGGVMSQPHLLPLIRTELQQLLHGYLAVPELGADVDQFIVAPGLGTRSGLLGSLALAQRGMEDGRSKMEDRN